MNQEVRPWTNSSIIFPTADCTRADMLLQTARMHMMMPLNLRVRIRRQLPGRKQPLPAKSESPLLRHRRYDLNGGIQGICQRILASQCNLNLWSFWRYIWQLIFKTWSNNPLHRDSAALTASPVSESVRFWHCYFLNRSECDPVLSRYKSWSVVR